MKISRTFSPVKITLETPEEVKSLLYALEETLHDRGWLWKEKKSKAGQYVLHIMEQLRKVPLATELD